MREILKVDGISPELKKQMQEAALRIFGKANASALARKLIADYFEKSKVNPIKELDFSEKNTRIEIRLPESVNQKIIEYSKDANMTKNSLIVSVILDFLGKPQLNKASLEELRKSNYELFKIGNNLNQIAKAFNLIVKSGSGKMPEIGKKMESLRLFVRDHTKLVLSVLDNKSFSHENKERKKHREVKHKPNERK